jgi:hypothetical protein
MQKMRKFVQLLPVRAEHELRYELYKHNRELLVKIGRKRFIALQRSMRREGSFSHNQNYLRHGDPYAMNGDGAMHVVDDKLVFKMSKLSSMLAPPKFL